MDDPTAPITGDGARFDPTPALQAAKLGGPGRLRRIVHSAAALGRAGFDYGDMLDEIENALWSDGTFRPDRPSKLRAWSLTVEAAETAHAEAFAFVEAADTRFAHQLAAEELLAGLPRGATSGDFLKKLLSATDLSVAAAERVADETLRRHARWGADPALRRPHRLQVMDDPWGQQVDFAGERQFMAAAERVAEMPDCSAKALRANAVESALRLADLAENRTVMEGRAVGESTGALSRNDQGADLYRTPADSLEDASMSDASTATVEQFQALDLSRPEAWNRPPASLTKMLRSERFDEAAEITPPRWLVKGVLPEAGLALLVGASSAGKSFFACDLAAAIKLGKAWFGRRVKGGTVAYVAAEGAGGLRYRLRSALQAPHHQEPKLAKPVGGGFGPKGDLHLVTEAPDLGPRGDPAPLVRRLEEIAANAPAAAPLRLVVIDTLHATMNGADENAASDMGKALSPLREIADRFGVCVLIVHHTGKAAEKGPRGSSALFAAMDSVLTMESAEGFVSDDTVRRVRLTKSRDGGDGSVLAYRMPVVIVGADEDGDDLTSRHLSPLGELPSERPGQAAVLEIVRLVGACLQDNGSAPLAAVREAYRQGRPALSPEAFRQAWSRATKSAEKTGAVVIDQQAGTIGLRSSAA